MLALGVSWRSNVCLFPVGNVWCTSFLCQTLKGLVWLDKYCTVTRLAPDEIEVRVVAGDSCFLRAVFVRVCVCECVRACGFPVAFVVSSGWRVSHELGILIGRLVRLARFHLITTRGD
jgi:hypothetical protein